MIQPSLFDNPPKSGSLNHDPDKAVGVYMGDGIGKITNPEYFNTTHLSGTELAESKAQTGLQDQRVLDIFKFHQQKFTPVQVWEQYQNWHGRVCLTSIRRSMTVLTKKGLLRKTDEKRMGKYGKVNYVWEVV